MKKIIALLVVLFFGYVLVSLYNAPLPEQIPPVTPHPIIAPVMPPAKEEVSVTATSTEQPTILKKEIPIVEPSPTEINALVLYDLTNIDRVQNGLKQLSYSTHLESAAKARVHDMASKGYFSHTDPDGNNSWYWFRLVDYKYHFAGENLGEGNFPMQTYEKTFMESPEHRVNILDKHFTQVGIATEYGYCRVQSECNQQTGQYVLFVAVMFGAPQQ